MKPAQPILALMFLVLLFAFWESLTEHRASLTEHRAEQSTVCEYPVDEAAATYIRGYREGGADANP